MPPVGFKRSRALWDDARRPRERKSDRWKSLGRAICYELQPLRISQLKLREKGIIAMEQVRNIGGFVVGTVLPYGWTALKGATRKHYCILAVAILYYFVLRWIHEMLDAGPLVVIITCLIGIFTVGLGDNADGELSAYSVFNRGYQKLMGSVDVEALVNQHVGGGGMMAMAAQQDMGNRQNINNNNHDNNNRGPRGPPIVEDDGDQDEDDSDDQDDVPQQNIARRSGKKARRQNLEERRELRRQRDAAMAMGLDGTNGPAEIMALQRLMEDQVVVADNDNQ